MLIKNTPAVNVKAGPDDGLDEGEFIVYPSTFIKVPDAYGDIVAPGAFLKDIQTWKNSGLTLPGLYGHRMDDPEFNVAGAKDMGEDSHGWWVKGFFDLEIPKARIVYRLVKGRRLNQLSFAYDTIDAAGVELENGVRAYELRELKVHEFSFVPVGANQDTSVVAVKSFIDLVASEVKAGRVLSAKNETLLRDAHEAIGTVLSAISTDEEKASGTDSSRQAPPEQKQPEGQPREAGQESSVEASALNQLVSIERELAELSF